MSETGVKISGLPALPTRPTGTEPVVIVRDSVTYRAPSSYLDNLAPSIPYATPLTGDEITGIEQGSERVLSTLNDQLRLTAARRAGLVFNNIAQAAGQLPSLGLQMGDVVTISDYASPGDAGGGLYERVASEPALPGKFQDDSGIWWQLRAVISSPEQFGAVGDGIADDTASFAAAATTANIVEMRAGKKYRLNAWKPAARCLILGTKGSSISKVAGASCAIDMSSGFVTLQNVFLDNEVFDANGNVDPNRAATSVMTAFGVNTITVSTGHGVRFAVGMTAFWDSEIDAGVGDTGRISAVNGDELTFDRDFDHNPVIGSKIIADFPLIKMDAGTFAVTVQNVTMRRCIVGLRTGGTLSSAGNAFPHITNLRVEAYTGAAIVQTTNMGTEVFSGVTIGGTNTITRRYTASAGQTVFEYGYNVTPYCHRGGPESSIKISVNGVQVTPASVSIDTAAVTVTIPTPCVGGEQIVVTNSEWSPRGMLCDGINGTVSDMGLMSNVLMLGLAVGCHIRGGVGGVEYLNLGNSVIDTCSYAGILLENTRSVTISGVHCTFIPYPVKIVGACSLIEVPSLITRIMPLAAIQNPSARPNLANIWVEPTATSVAINRGGWFSTSETVYDPGNVIIWSQHSILMESGTQGEPSLAFRAAKDIGWYFDDATGAWWFTAGGVRRMSVAQGSLGINAGASGAPGLTFMGTQSGLRRAVAPLKDRWAVDGVDRWFWGTADVGPMGVPLRLSSFPVIAANALTDMTDGAVIYCPNGNAGAPCLAVRSGGAWKRVPLGAAISSVS